ncbi:MAG: hypothetical protein RIS09_1169 [Actinomycetota bacterium]|jgi:hypothetical protein
MTREIPEDLWQAYCTTNLIFHVNNKSLRLMPADAGTNQWPWPATIGQIVIISAINPFSEPSEANEIPVLQASMQRELERLNYTFLQCTGTDQSNEWQEESFLVLNPDEEHISRLCHDFQQYAYFLWTKDSWSVKSVVSSQVFRTNWNLVETTL